DFTPFVEASETGQQDIIGDGYQFLIKKFASDSGKKAGDFYTPAEVSQLIARLMAPRAGDRIYDPTCGSGSLLITVAQQVRDAEGARSRDFAIYGQELNASTWALAKMNTFVHGIDGASILRGDTISSPKHREGDALLKADVVVANPPFSLKKWGYEDAEADPFGRFKRPVLPPTSKGDYAFLLHMLHSAKHDVGRVGVVVPHGVLFRGSREGTIREQLIRENLLDAVIGLPAGLFYGTGIPAAILVFKKRRAATDVLFIDASRDYDDADTQNKLRKQDLDRIVAAYEVYADADKYAYRAPFEEIEENDFNLNIPRYVDTFEEEEPVDLEALADEIRQIESWLARTREELDGYLRELGLPA
ncbi:MAG: type I restriction-modification system subunit M, partial [Bacteroidota bacterium]